MKKLFSILLTIALFGSAFSSWAEDAILVPDTINNYPEWYVAPEIPDSLRAPFSEAFSSRAPQRAKAAVNCSKVEAILSYDIDSVLTEGTYYEYDDNGNTISMTIWSFNPDGSMVGNSKKEYSFDSSGEQTMTATYTWDNTVNDWNGTAKYEYAFNAAGQMTSNTTFIWLNQAWYADKRYTYAYDADGREIEYYEYKRNTTTNQLEKTKGLIQEWYDATTKTREIQYTAFANNEPIAGSWIEQHFDADGNKTLEMNYPSMANGKWVGSSKEIWEYTDNVLTMNAKYGWANGDWSGTLKEVWGYTDGTKTLYEKYTGYNNGSWVGSLKETWEYTGSNLTLHMQYGWGNNDWVYSAKEQWEFNAAGKKTLYLKEEWTNGVWAESYKEIWNFNASGKQTLHEQYDRVNGTLAKILEEQTEYSGKNITRIENYQWINGVKTGTHKEEHSYNASNKETSSIIYTWENGAWVGQNKEEWTFNASGKETKHEAFEWSSGWSVTLQENTGYDASGNNTLVENYIWTGGVKTGTKKEEYAYTSGQNTQTVAYVWTDGAWVESTKEVLAFTSGKQTLHELYGWNGDWTILSQENTTYTGSDITKIENYEWINGVKTGTKKEEYAYAGSQKTLNAVYDWENGAWVGISKEVWGYTLETLTLHELYVWANGDWEIASQEKNTYDAAGKNIVEESSVWTNGVRTGTRIYTTYNSDDAITEVLRLDWSATAADWVNGARMINTYNEEGVNIMTYTTSWDGTRWTLYSMTRTDIIKDAEGRELLNASWSCGSDSIWVGIKKDTVAYTATNKPLYSASYKGWANGDWVPYLKSEYTYDAADHQLLIMHYEGQNGVWVNKAKTEQSYDAAGNQILVQGFNWSNNAWVGVYKYEYAYDAAGRQTMQAHYEWSSGRWSGFSRSETEYDAVGNITASISFQWKNNAWVKKTRTENVYDSKNRVIEYTQKKWQSNKWVNSRHNIYVYDQQGRLVSTRKYWWYNNEWTLYDINDKEYDSSGNPLRRELLVSWLDNELESYADKHYFYDCDPDFYTIRFVNHDGEVLEYQMAIEGQTPIFMNDKPTRQSTAEFTYTFAGWTPEPGPATSHTTYTAAFSAIKNTYSITFKNGAEVLQSTQVAYGEKPDYAGATPTKEADAQYSYTFAGWDKTIEEVTGEATYNATFSSTVNKYTVLWLNEDGTEIEQTTVEYGVIPTHADATKESTAEWTYTFAGWDKEVVAVTGAATYTATFTAAKNSYTVTFKNGDEVLQSTEVEYGMMPTYSGAEPTKEGDAQNTYTFAGWDKEFASVTGNVTYTATFIGSTNSYTITWLNDDNSLINETTVEYGVIPTHADATKESTAEWTYTFAGWDKEVVAVTGAATYTATFTAAKNSYTITWLNDDNTQIDQTTVAYGVIPTHEDATKTNTAEYTYTFAGWDKEVVAVTGAATYTATFTAAKNSYTVTFKNGDEVLQSTEVEYGLMPTYSGAEPTKEGDAQNTYTFAGWDKELASVTGAATYTATFTAAKNSYTITWLNDDNTQIDQTTVEYGVIPTHDDPTKESTAEFTYTFVGWDVEPVAVTGDATYTATYSSTTESYTITWLNDDNTQIDQTTVEYGVIPTHEDATKTNTAEYTYTFAGWDKEVVAVTGAATYTATFTAAKNSYTVTFKNGDEVLQSTEVEYGMMPTYNGAEPTKEGDAQNTYTFAGWDKEFASVTGNVTYVATFSTISNTALVTFKNGDVVLQSSEVTLGALPVYTGATPTKDSDAQYSYTFVGWNKELSAVTGETTYTAVFESTVNTYTVTFYFDDGVTVLDQMTLPYGQVPSTSYVPSRNADEHCYYVFTGWSPEIAPVTGDVSYTPTYAINYYEYTIIFKNYDNRELQRRKVPYGSIPEYEGKTPSKSSTVQYTYTFAGWSPEVTAVSGDATYTAVYESALREYMITFLDEDGSELDVVAIPYGQMPSTTVVPTKEPDDDYTYTFVGWSPKLKKVTGKATYTATYLSIPKTHEGLNDIPVEEVPKKVMIDGVIYIIRAGKTYTLDGTLVSNP